MPPLARMLVDADGRRTDAKLVGADWPARLRFEINGQNADQDVANVVRWGAPRDATRGHGVILNGLSRFVVDQWELDETRLTVPLGAASVATELNLPRTSVRGVMLIWPADAAQRDRRWRQIVESRLTQDQLLLDNGDSLAGTIERTIRMPAEADAGPDDAEPAVAIKTAAGRLTIPLERIAAITFRGAPSAPEPVRAPHCLLGFADGSLLDVKAARSEGDRYSVTLVDDTTFATDPQWLWSDAVFVQPLDAKTVYLSDLPELGYKHVPLLEREWPFGRDRNVLGHRLQHGATTWFKGLGMHSTSRLAYDLNGEYSSFQAELAIDDLADRRGSVIFRVYVDRGEGAWQNAFESPIVRHGVPVRPIQVDLRGALRMALIVDAADWGDVGDHANWLDARLIPTAKPR